MAEEATDVDAAEQVHIISDEERSEIITRVMSENSGKLEEDLAKEIESATKQFEEDKIKQNEEDLKLIDAVKAEEGNSELTDDEAWELLQKREEDKEKPAAVAKPKVVENDDLGVDSDFVITPGGEEVTDENLPDEVKSQLAELKALKEDKLLNGFLVARDAGVDFREYLSSMSVGVNLETMTPTEIIEKGLKLFLDTKRMSQEAYDREVDALEDMDESNKIFKSEQFRGVLKQQVDAIEDSFLSTAQKMKERSHEIATKATSELSEFVNTAAGKRFYGLEVTPEMAKKVQDYISGGKFNQYRADGTVDVERVGKLAMFELFNRDIFKNLSKKSEIKGEMREFKKRSRPSRTGFKTNTKGTAGVDGYKAAVQRKRGDSKIRLTNN
jgi:hypothetical protein